MQRAEQYVCRIITLWLKNSEQIFPVEGKEGNHKHRRGVYPRLRSSWWRTSLQPSAKPQALQKSLGRKSRAREIAGSIRLHNHVLESWCISHNIQFWRSQKTHAQNLLSGESLGGSHGNFKDIICPLEVSKDKVEFHIVHKYPFPCSKAHRKVKEAQRGKKSSPGKHEHITHFWICLRGDEQPPHLLQITPKPTIPSPERGIWSLLHSYCVSLSLRLQTQAFNSIPLNLGGCTEVTDPCSQPSQLLFLKRTINQIRLVFMNEHF